MKSEYYDLVNRGRAAILDKLVFTYSASDDVNVTIDLVLADGTHQRWTGVVLPGTSSTQKTYTVDLEETFVVVGFSYDITTTNLVKLYGVNIVIRGNAPLVSY